MVSFSLLQMSIEIWCSMISLFCAISVALGRRYNPLKQRLVFHLLLWNAVLLFSDTLALAFRGVETRLGFLIVRISNFLVFAIIPLMLLLITFYLQDMIRENKGKEKKALFHLIYTLCIIHMLFILVGQFTSFLYYFDKHNVYHRGPAFPLITGLAWGQMFLLLVILVLHRNYINQIKMEIMALFIILPMISSIIQLFHYGISLNNVATNVSLILLFLSEQVDKTNRLHKQKQKLLENEIALKDQELILSKKELELKEARNQIMLSQMQPHFMFNALGGIEQLCRVDSSRAAEATHKFSHFLRNNINALSQSTMVPFKEELAQIHSYIWLEQLRFGEDLGYSEEIRSTSFLVPIQSVQTLILHAVMQGMGCGDLDVIRIQLTVGESDRHYIIRITGNFIPSTGPISDREKALNTIFPTLQEQLALMCQGKLEAPQPGSPYACTVRIPKAE